METRANEDVRSLDTVAFLYAALEGAGVCHEFGSTESEYLDHYHVFWVAVR
jgi:hypothetical protein